MKYFWWRCLLLMLIAFSGVVRAEPSLSPYFEAAQKAAAEGQYRDVVTVLTKALEDESLDDPEQVVGYANRGIAYSLLGAYGLAKADLLAAVRLNPEHNLTLNHLGIIAEHVDDNLTDARGYYQRAANNGFAAAEVNLAQLMLNDASGETAAARNLLESAVSKGYVLGNVPLANLLMRNTATRDRAMQLLNEAFAAGVVAAGYHLGEAYQFGRGVKVNLQKAYDYYLNAAMQGHSDAQNVVGYFHRQGRVVAQNFDEAVTWYQLAADQGNMQAANRLAWLLATCPTKTVCNGPAALSLASSVVESDRSPSTLDSLAAAYARSGQFDEAVTVIESMLQQYGDAATRYRSRLNLYRQGLPYQL